MDNFGKLLVVGCGFAYLVSAYQGFADQKEPPIDDSTPFFAKASFAASGSTGTLTFIDSNVPVGQVSPEVVDPHLVQQIVKAHE